MHACSPLDTDSALVAHRATIMMATVAGRTADQAAPTAGQHFHKMPLLGRPSPAPHMLQPAPPAGRGVQVGVLGARGMSHSWLMTCVPLRA